MASISKNIPFDVSPQVVQRPEPVTQQFPPADEWWKTLQETVISFTGKPIEDLEKKELKALIPLLNEVERLSMVRYLDRRRQPSELVAPPQVNQSSPSDLRRGRCELSMSEVMGFAFYVKYLTSLLLRIESRKDPYLDLLHKFDRAIKKSQSGWPGLRSDESESLLFSIYFNLAAIPPTATNRDMLRAFYKKFHAREAMVNKLSAKKEGGR
jgi:hypothetical protein